MTPFLSTKTLLLLWASDENVNDMRRRKASRVLRQGKSMKNRVIGIVIKLFDSILFSYWVPLNASDGFEPSNACAIYSDELQNLLKGEHFPRNQKMYCSPRM